MALAEANVSQATAPAPASVQEVAGLTAGLEQLTRPVALARERCLPVVPALTSLLAEGALRRGTTVAVSGSALLALALVAGPSGAGSWVGAVGLGDLGVAAAGHVGVALERLALVPRVEPRQWATVVAALLDGLDVVVAGLPPRVRAADVRRLVARARERGSVLVTVGRCGDGTDLALSVGAGEWQGLGRGHGCLVARRAEVVARGRGAAARERRAWLWLPSSDGSVAVG